VQLFAIRFAALGVLVGLYALSPVVGVAALATGFGFLLGQRMRLQRADTGDDTGTLAR
jgi:hypothetical protein